MKNANENDKILLFLLSRKTAMDILRTLITPPSLGSKKPRNSAHAHNKNPGIVIGNTGDSMAFKIVECAPS